ncbi:alpha/beta hydrolase [Telluria beijingensis]|uniref:alpha/beta hydrolase n=1 Tax=Telluria beijingensis TaxID=3068633 RepID=UPI0027960982|nr:alpha/beta hydrolase [Massilia sp. REN29]
MKRHEFAATNADLDYVVALLGDQGFQANYSGPTTIEQMRTGTALLVDDDKLKDVPAGVEVTPMELAGRPAERLHGGAPDTGKVIVYLHGGGFIRGSLDMGRANAAELAHAARVPVISVAYRQAPEHPFPAATEDILAVYRALLARGYLPGQIVVAGESAGGCLALTLLPHLVQEGLALPAGVAGISPMTDLRMSGASWDTNAGRDIATREMGRRMVGLYIREQDLDHPLAAPVNGAVPPAAPILLCVGTHETMLSDVERYAGQADAAGADVTLNLYQAMPHGFTKFAIPLARQAIADVARWCAARLGRA